MTPNARCAQCGLTPGEAERKKSVEDHQSFQPVVGRYDEQERIELHWYGWGGPIETLPPLCRLTRAQTHQLVMQLTGLLDEGRHAGLHVEEES